MHTHTQGPARPHWLVDLSRSSPPEKLALASCLAVILLLQASKRRQPPLAPKRVGLQCLSPSPTPSVTAIPGAPEQGLRQGLLLVPWQVLAVGLWGRRLHPPRHPPNSLVWNHTVCSRCDPDTNSAFLTMHLPYIYHAFALQSPCIYLQCGRSVYLALLHVQCVLSLKGSFTTAMMCSL